MARACHVGMLQPAPCAVLVAFSSVVWCVAVLMCNEQCEHLLCSAKRFSVVGFSKGMYCCALSNVWRSKYTSNQLRESHEAAVKIVLAFHSPVVTICTASLTLNDSTFCPHSVFMCSVWIWEQTAIISLYSINWLVCITETKCVYCAVRTGSLYIILRSAHSVFMCFVWIWEQTAIISLYSINWLVFITETECVYCAVRTGSLTVI